MDFFNSLWDDPGQQQTPKPEDFGKDIAVEKWINHSSTYKLIGGNFTHPQDWLLINKYYMNGAIKPQKHVEGQGAPSGRSGLEQNKGKSRLTEEGKDDSKSDHNCQQGTPSSSFETHKYIPGLRKDPCPDKMSCLDYQEHLECLALYLKFSGGTMMPSDRADCFRFEIMYQKVQEEQAAYCQEALNHWLKEAKSESQQIFLTQLQLLQIFWMMKAKRALELYPHIYKKKSIIPLCPAALKVEMIKIADLLQMGRIPAFFDPSLIAKTVAQTNTSKLLASSQYNLSPEETLGSIHKLPVSHDPNAESLARLHKAQVVVSSGALHTLLEAYFDHSKSWTLPITVKEYRTIENGKTTTKSIVFIDKPLPRQSMTAYECHRFLFKYAVKGRLLHRNHQLCFTFPIPGVGPLNTEKSPPSNEEKNDADESGNPAPTEKESNDSEKQGCGEEMDDSDDSDDDKLVIEEEPLPSATGKTEVKTEPRPSLSSVTHAESEQQEPLRKRDGLKLPKTPEGYTAPISQANVTYSSWVMRPENDGQLSVHQKKTQKELTVIVRCQVDGCEKIDKEIAAVCLSPKPEYQIEFAAGEATKEELLWEWASVFFKPASLVVRTRVDVKNGEIIMCEKKNKSQLSADALRLHNVRLNDSLQTVYSVFSELASLAKGSYLLHHSPEDNAFASLEESVEGAHDKSKLYRNLKDSLNGRFSVSPVENPAWRKIDCNVILPRHRSFNVMPATYRPKPCDSVSFKARTIPTKRKEFGAPKPKKNRKKKPHKTKPKKEQNPAKMESDD